MKNPESKQDQFIEYSDAEWQQFIKMLGLILNVDVVTGEELLASLKALQLKQMKSFEKRRGKEPTAVALILDALTKNRGIAALYENVVEEFPHREDSTGRNLQQVSARNSLKGINNELGKQNQPIELRTIKLVIPVRPEKEK